jgi:hypothetical protein
MSLSLTPPVQGGTMSRSGVAVLVAMALFPLFAQAQAFWNGTAYGNSLDEVRAKEPTAQLHGPDPQHGVVAMLSAKTRLVEREFNVFYYFTNRGLDRVILQSATEMGAEQEAASQQALIQAIVHRYGRAKNTESAAGLAAGRALWFTWEAGDTNVLLISRSPTHPMHLMYTFADRSSQRADAARAKAYRNKVDPKAESGRL